MIVIIVPINPCLLLIECMSISQRSPNNARCLSAWIPSLVRCVGVMEKNIILSIKNVWLKKFFWTFNLQSSIQDSWLKKFFWIFNLQSSIQDSWLKKFFWTFNLQSSIQDSWLKKFFWTFNLQSSIQQSRTLDCRSSSVPSIFNLQSRALDWRSFSGPSIFNLQSRTLDWRSSSGPSIFNLQSRALDWRSFPGPSIFNFQSWFEVLNLQFLIRNKTSWYQCSGKGILYMKRFSTFGLFPKPEKGSEHTVNYFTTKDDQTWIFLFKK